jgi:hypothetical protein
MKKIKWFYRFAAVLLLLAFSGGTTWAGTGGYGRRNINNTINTQRQGRSIQQEIFGMTSGVLNSYNGQSYENALLSELSIYNSQIGGTLGNMALAMQNAIKQLPANGELNTAILGTQDPLYFTSDGQVLPGWMYGMGSDLTQYFYSNQNIANYFSNAYTNSYNSSYSNSYFNNYYSVDNYTYENTNINGRSVGVNCSPNLGGSYQTNGKGDYWGCSGDFIPYGGSQFTGSSGYQYAGTQYSGQSFNGTTYNGTSYTNTTSQTNYAGSGTYTNSYHQGVSQGGNTVMTGNKNTYQQKSLSGKNTSLSGHQTSGITGVNNTTIHHQVNYQLLGYNMNVIDVNNVTYTTTTYTNHYINNYTNNYTNYWTNYYQNTNYYVQDYTTWTSPLVLNLKGNGVLEASGGRWLPHPGYLSHHQRLFDFYGNGFPVVMEWVGPDDGILVHLKPGQIRPNGTAHLTGLNFFGTAAGFDNGFQELSLLDKDHDGVLKGKELKGLYVWQDKNQNAKVDPGELKSVQQLGITEIFLAHKNSEGYFIQNGEKKIMWDWWPNVSQVVFVPKKSSK